MAKSKEAAARGKREVRIAAPEETADVRFRENGTGVNSPYRDLLEDLQDAPKGSTLKISRTARYTALKHIRTLGLRVAWGKKGDDLYIKILGSVDAQDEPLTVTKVVKAAAVDRAVKAVTAATGLDSASKVVLRALEQGPCTLREVAKCTGATPASCAERLTRLAEAGLVECEDGVYRLKARAAFTERR